MLWSVKQKQVESFTLCEQVRWAKDGLFVFSSEEVSAESDIRKMQSSKLFRSYIYIDRDPHICMYVDSFQTTTHTFSTKQEILNKNIGA